MYAREMLGGAREISRSINDRLVVGKIGWILGNILDWIYAAVSDSDSSKSSGAFSRE